MIYKDAETRKNILEGAEKLYDAVRTTMGPKGRNVLIKDKFGNFSITHDGVTVARAVKDDDPKVQLGIDLIKRAAMDMDGIGDGTTTVTVLAYHLIAELSKLVDAGMNPMYIRRELPAISNAVIMALDKKVKQIERNQKAIFDIAFISAADKELAEGIAEVIVGTGYEGAVNVEMSVNQDTTFEVVKGFSFAGGYASPHFITDNHAREVKLKNPAVILLEGTLERIDEMAQIYDALVNEGVKDILLVADNVSPDILNLLIVNKAKMSFNSTLVKNTIGRERLHDLAAITGAHVINVNEISLDKLKSIGRAEAITVKGDETIIFGGMGNPTDRIAELKTQEKDTADSEITERISLMVGTIGSIQVGGQNEEDAKERKYRVDDAVAATRAAVRDGILAGGGSALWEVADPYSIHEDGDMGKIREAVYAALSAPIKTLLENSGIDESMVEVIEPGECIDVTTADAECVDAFDSGIVDPAAVTIGAVKIAFAVAANAISIGGAVVEKPVTQEELATIMSAGR